MQAFLWRHLVPARDLKGVIFDPAYQPPPKRAAPVRSPAAIPANAAVAANATSVPPASLGTNAAALTNAAVGTNGLPAAAAKPKFSKQQIAGRLRQLKLLFEEGLLTDEFYDLKVAECEAAQ